MPPLPPAQVAFSSVASVSSEGEWHLVLSVKEFLELLFRSDLCVGSDSEGEESVGEKYYVKFGVVQAEAIRTLTTPI